MLRCCEVLASTFVLLDYAASLKTVVFVLFVVVVVVVVVVAVVVQTQKL